MFCSKCGYSNAEESVFCLKCGSKLSLGLEEDYNCHTISKLKKSKSENKESSGFGGLFGKLWNSSWLSEKAEGYPFFDWILVPFDFTITLLVLSAKAFIFVGIFAVLTIFHITNIYRRFKEEHHIRDIYEMCPKCGRLTTGADTCSICRVNTRPLTSGECYTIRSKNDKSVNTNKIGVLILTFFISVLCILIVSHFLLGRDSREISAVKKGAISAFDYGIPIGDALDDWFDGTEKWDSYNRDGKKYVVCEGYTTKTLTKQSERQCFVFIMDDENKDSFVFKNAYDVNGDPIYSQTGNMGSQLNLQIANDFLGLFGYDIHRFALEAAFGDKERLKYFE